MWHTDDGHGMGHDPVGHDHDGPLWGAIVGLIVWGVQSVTRRERYEHEDANAGSRAHQASDIASERYAHGDIDREEFEQILSTLERHPGTTRHN
jgi:hypothetical protein